MLRWLLNLCKNVTVFYNVQIELLFKRSYQNYERISTAKILAKIVETGMFKNII